MSRFQGEHKKYCKLYVIRWIIATFKSVFFLNKKGHRGFTGVDGAKGERGESGEKGATGVGLPGLAGQPVS